MKWLNFDSLKKRYAIIASLLGIIVLVFSAYEQNQITIVKNEIRSNISSRNALLKRSTAVQTAILKSRDMLFKFQIDPDYELDRKIISQTIHDAIVHIKILSTHHWIKKHYLKDINKLIFALQQFDKTSTKLINTRLNPQLLFPAIKIASVEMQPLFAEMIENIQLALKDMNDNGEYNKHTEYVTFTELRFYLSTMVSNFRMYLLNQLNAFDESYRQNQLNLITEFQIEIGNKIIEIENLKRDGQLSFTSIIALEKLQKIYPVYLTKFKKIKVINESPEWRMDTVIYQNELNPTFVKINSLLSNLNQSIEQFSANDIKVLTKITQHQVQAIWTASIITIIVFVIGFIFLVKHILNPITNVTNALKKESQGIDANLQINTPIQETKDLIIAFKEMRQQINTRQQELEFHALHDSLTGLANRNLLIDRLNQAIHNAKQEGSSFAVLLMDLDRFKDVNDTLGHSVGDKLLQQVAQRLTTLLREVDVIVRLGGDEFSVLLNVTDNEHAELIAAKIINEFQQVFIVEDTPLYIGISIGIAIYPEHGTTTKILQQRADVAMYVAKRNKLGFTTYDTEFDDYSIGKLALISELRHAINENQLFMEYQPIIDIKTNTIMSAEALLRWHHPENGTIYPDKIIPIAEQTGLINPITYWIIDSVAKYNKKLIENNINIKIAINLSVYNLQDVNFVEKVIDIFERNEISPSNFVMEVTESVMMKNPNQSIEVLNQLNELGIDISVDDYGTGYSSLSYLKKLPISKLKIDKSFIIDMMENDSDAMIVRSTIDLARNLGMDVIAEGIETNETLELLSILSCRLVQGYYICKPISGEAFQLWALNKNEGKMDI